MKIHILPLGPIQTNCYIVVDETTGKCLVIDPGGDGDKVVRFIEENKLELEAIALTHGHFDHIGGIESIMENMPVPLYMHSNDKAFLDDSNLNLSIYMGKGFSVKAHPILVKEGDGIACGKLQFTVIETPGHTTGGICYYGNGVLFSGDTLFKHSIGRTDFPGGNQTVLINNVKSKLYKLPVDTIVYPGHGEKTTIGEEIKGNVFTR